MSTRLDCKLRVHSFPYHRLNFAFGAVLSFSGPLVILAAGVNSGFLLRSFPWLIFWLGSSPILDPNTAIGIGIPMIIILFALRSFIRKKDIHPPASSSHTMARTSYGYFKHGLSQPDHQRLRRGAEPKRRSLQTATALTISALAFSGVLVALSRAVSSHPTQLISYAVRASRNGHIFDAYESLSTTASGHFTTSKSEVYYLESGWALDLHLRGAALHLSSYLFRAAARDHNLGSLVLAFVQSQEARSEQLPRGPDESGGLGQTAHAPTEAAPHTLWAREYSAVIRVVRHPDVQALRSLDRTFHAIAATVPVSQQQGLLEAASVLKLYLKESYL